MLGAVRARQRELRLEHRQCSDWNTGSVQNLGPEWITVLQLQTVQHPLLLHLVTQGLLVQKEAPSSP